MIYQTRILVLVILLTFSLSAHAEDVYKSVDEQGIVEFSDEASPGAEKVDVQPNVLTVDPAQPVKPVSPTTASGAAEARAPNQQREERREGEFDDDYYADDGPDLRRQREERLENRKREEHREATPAEPMRDEVPGRAIRNRAR